MGTESYLQFDEVKKKIEDHLKIAVGDVEKSDITSAKLETASTGNQEAVWRVTVEYERIKYRASFTLTAKTGEVREFSTEETKSGSSESKTH
jgi:coenzyme F420-reducing hydrogenase beta subunit